MESLYDYLKGNNKEIFQEVERLNQRDGVKTPISQKKIIEWCDGCESLNDLVALASVSFRYSDRSSLDGFKKISELLVKADLPIIKREHNELRHITLVSAVMDGPHAKLIFSYVAVLLCMKNITNVSLIFTGEWQWFAWRRAKYVERISKLYELCYEQLKQYNGGRLAYYLYRRKLKIFISPKGKEFSKAIGDMVVRFEGPAPFRSTYIFNSILKASYPVVTVPFSSHISSSCYSFATLVRNQNLIGSGDYFYIPPFAPEEIKKKNKYKRDKNKKYLLSAYSGDRIRKMFRTFTKTGTWESVTDFLQCSNLYWIFVGARNVELAYQQIPPEHRVLLGDKIQVLGFSELNPLFRDAFAYIAVPGVFGGGRTSGLAISHDVPVLTVRDDHSDVSNSLSDEVQYNSLEEIFSAVMSWESCLKGRELTIKKQNAFLNERKNIFKKAEELNGILIDIYNKSNFERCKIQNI